MFKLNRYAIFLILCIFLSSCSNSGDKNGNNTVNIKFKKIIEK